MWEGHCIHTPAPGHEPDLAASAQSVDGEKYLVPCQTGALTYDFFEVRHMDSAYDLDYLIFYGRVLCMRHQLGNTMHC